MRKIIIVIIGCLLSSLSMSGENSSHSFKAGEEYFIRGIEENFHDANKFRPEGLLYSVHVDFNVKVLDSSQGVPIKNSYKVKEAITYTGDKADQLIPKGTVLVCSRQSEDLHVESHELSPPLIELLNMLFICLEPRDSKFRTSGNFFRKLIKVFPKKIETGKTYNIDPKPFYESSPIKDEFDTFDVKLQVLSSSNGAKDNCTTINIFARASKQDKAGTSFINDKLAVESVEGPLTNWVKFTKSVDLEDHSSTQGKYLCRRIGTEVFFKARKKRQIYYDKKLKQIILSK